VGIVWGGVERELYAFFKNRGLCDNGIFGLLGNLYAESGMRPENLQDSSEKKSGFTDREYTAAVDDGSYKNFIYDSAGYGLAQWTHWSRKKAMLAYHRGRGVSIGDLLTQAEFLYKELSENYKAVLSTLKTAASIREASDAVLLKFERPADQGVAVREKRARYGLEYEALYRKEGENESMGKETIVAVDAGHGSETAGKRTPDGYREHWINVNTARYCEEYLNSRGIRTVRIGWDDTNAGDDPDIGLTARQKLVKQAGCRLSVSMHANAYGNGWNNANGVETLVHSNAACRRDSLNLANFVQNRLVEGTQQSNRKVKTDRLSMCRADLMGTEASCLVEIGFMTNSREAELMKSQTFCREQGEDVARGVIDYLKSRGLFVGETPVKGEMPTDHNPFKKPDSTIALGTTGEDAEYGEWWLWRFGMLLDAEGKPDVSRIDGVIDAADVEAIKHAQTVLGFTGKDVDGRIGPATKRKFEETI